MTIAMAHSGRNAGSTVAEINLKFLSKFMITDEQVGKDNEAYVVGPAGPPADSNPNVAWAWMHHFPRSRP